LIDGDPAGSAADHYPTIPVSLTIVANQLNELPYLPHLHRQHERFTPIRRRRRWRPIPTCRASRCTSTAAMT